jgi:uncharacterized phage infection (PIP) family protein YhgE
MIKVGLGLADELTPALKTAEGSVSAFSKFVTTRLNALTHPFTALRTGFAGVASFVGFGLAKGIADLNEQIEDLSATLGVSTEFLSSLRFGAKNAGVDFQQLEGALTRLSQGFSELQTKGTGPVATGLKLLGPEFVENARAAQNLESLLGVVADAFLEVDNSQQRVSASLELFGRGGQRLIPLLRDGSKGIQDVRRESDRLGVTLDEQGIAKSRAFTQAIERFGGAFENLKRTALEPILPILAKVLDLFSGIAGAITSIPKASESASKALDSLSVIILDQFTKGRASQLLKDIEEASKTAETDPMRSIEQFLQAPERRERERRRQEAEEQRRRDEEFQRQLPITKAEADRQAAEQSARQEREKFRRELEEEISSGRSVVLESGIVVPATVEQMLATRERRIASARRDRVELIGEEAVRAEEFDRFLTEIQSFQTFGDVSEIDQTVDAVGKLAAELDRVESPLAGIKSGLDEIAQRGSTFEVFRGAITGLADSLTQNLSAALTSVAQGASSLRDVFKDLARSVLADIQQIVIRALVLRAVTGAFGLFGGSALGGVGFGGSFQRGGIGRHPSGGELILAHGSEAHIPLPSGGRVPVEIQNGASREPVTVNLTINAQAIDSKSFDDRFFESAARRSRELANVVAAAFSRSPDVREGFR